MLVLAMEFSRSECRRRGLIDPRRDSGGQPAIPLKGSSALTRHAAAEVGRSGTERGGCPFKTEQKDPDLSPARSEDESCDGRVCSRFE
jgi:hypothetical protein